MERSNLPVVTLPDVQVTIYEKDHSLLQCLVNRAASRGSVVEQLNQAFAQFGPYRNIDPKIFEGVKIYRDGNRSFSDVSRQLVGDTSLARRIRYWYHELFGAALNG